MSESSFSSDDMLTVRSEPIWIGLPHQDGMSGNQKKTPSAKKKYTIQELQEEIDKKQKLTYCYSLIKERLNEMLLDNITRFDDSSKRVFSRGDKSNPRSSNSNSKQDRYGNKKSKEYRSYISNLKSESKPSFHLFDKEELLSIYSLLRKVFTKFNIQTVEDPPVVLPMPFESPSPSPSPHQENPPPPPPQIPDPRILKNTLKKNGSYSKLQMMKDQSPRSSSHDKIVKLPNASPSPRLLAYDQRTISTPTPANPSMVTTPSNYNTLLIQDSSPPQHKLLRSPRLKKKKKPHRKVRQMKEKPMKEKILPDSSKLTYTPMTSKHRETITPRTINTEKILLKDDGYTLGDRHRQSKKNTSSGFESGFDTPRTNTLASWRRSSSIPRIQSNQGFDPRAFLIPPSSKLTKRRRASTSSALKR